MVIPALSSDSVVLSGLSGTLFNAASVKTASVSVTANGPTTLLVDGRKVASGSSGTLSASLAGLGDGRHTITVEVENGFPHGTSRTSKTITVDSTAPTLQLAVPTKAVAIKDGVTVTGTVNKGASLLAPGGTLTQQGASFTVRYAAPPASAQIVATDAAGNATTQLVTVPTAYPHNIRAVHMTGAAWAYAPLRNPVLQMIKDKRINAVQLDIKDEDGIVNYASAVPIAKAAGATSTYYDATKVTAQLHSLGVRVIGRIVAFNDPKLASYAEAHGEKDWFIQKPDGSKYLYGYNRHGFTNFANREVRIYNEDLAVEASQGRLRRRRLRLRAPTRRQALRPARQA